MERISKTGKDFDETLNEIVKISPEGLVTITLEELVPITIPIIVRCVDRSADFYGQTASFEIILKVNTGGHIGGI